MDPGLLNCLNGPGKPLVDLVVKTPGSILGSGEIFERSLLACVFGWKLAILCDCTYMWILFRDVDSDL